jgi:FAD-linked oxidoreductase
MSNTAFSNWSGSVKFQPETVVYPTSESEIIQLVQRAANERKKIRVVGTGHSFTPLIQTDQILVSLDKWQGITHIDQAKGLVTVKAGTKIHQFGAWAKEAGWAQENLGDIDQQSLAGAISTGTHGTGINFGTIATQVRAITFINGKGERIHCSEEDNIEIFKAASLSLGSLGIIIELTFQCLPAYKLEFIAQREDIDDVLNSLDSRNKEHRNFEFYWFPYTNAAHTKYSNVTDAENTNHSINYIMDLILENYGYWCLSFPTRIIPSISPFISKTSTKLISRTRKVDWSYRIYSMPRLVKFNEMEYNIPAEAFVSAKREVIKAMEKHRFMVHFPTENRFVRADDIYLSPAYQRQSAYIAFHVFKGNPYQAYFKTMEEICLAHGGRPHWGKMHTLKAEQLQALYPKFDAFKQIRKFMDPEEVFTSSYLQALFYEPHHNGRDH